VKFDAKEWVRMAKDAGMKYLVITSKHHDGFGMYRSGLTDWCIKSTPFRATAQELADACASRLKLCFYHSIMDWHHPDWGTRRKWNDRAPATPPDMDRYTAFMKGQLKELLTGYGPIGIAWFDGEWESPWTHERGWTSTTTCAGCNRTSSSTTASAKAAPACRAWTRAKGWATTERRAGNPAHRVRAGGDWESCMTMNNHWGYNKNDQNWKSTRTLVRNLVDCASKGGNYLLNIGPTAEGTFPQASIERWPRWANDEGQWRIHLRHHRQPVQEAGLGPLHQKPGKLYLHVYDWPKGGSLDLPIATPSPRPTC